MMMTISTYTSLDFLANILRNVPTCLFLNVPLLLILSFALLLVLSLLLLLSTSLLSTIPGEAVVVEGAGSSLLVFFIYHDVACIFFSMCLLHSITPLPNHPPKLDV